MKVLHLVKTSTGATWAYRQMRELVKLGLEIHVALPPGGPLVAQYQQAGVVVHELQTDFPSRRPWRFPAIRRELCNLIARVQPDLIHSHFVGTTLTARLALGKHFSIPRIFQVPGPLHLEHWLFRHADLATAGPRDYWIGSCQWTSNCYRRNGIAPERVFLSYYGTDIDRYSVCPPGKLRRELQVAPEAPVVGMVAYMYGPKYYLGQFRGLKGHEDLIDAVALARKDNSDITCVFVGGAWNRAHHYEQRVRSYGRKCLGRHAVFLGTRSDVPELYPDFNVVVHPSLSENVGGAAESLLCAVPTIATNVGGFPDVVRPGDTGWLVPPQRPDLLAESILHALRAPEQSRELAKRGQILTRELFNVKRTAAEVVRIYDTIRPCVAPHERSYIYRECVA